MSPKALYLIATTYKFKVPARIFSFDKENVKATDATDRYSSAQTLTSGCVVGIPSLPAKTYGSNPCGRGERIWTLVELYDKCEPAKQVREGFLGSAPQ